MNDTSTGRGLTWGLLGTSRINRVVIPPLRESRRNRLAAVASRTRERAEAYAAEWGIDRAYGSYEALLAAPDIDVVYVGLPNALHAEWTIAAVRAGKHVLCEKPLATTVEDVERIIEAARRAGRVVAEAFMYRHHPQTDLVRRLVREGAVGDVRLVSGTFRFLHTRLPDVRWVPELGGGSLWDVGCYPVSYARWVLGAEPVEVFGMQRLTDEGVDDTFVGQLRFPGGVLGAFDCGFRAPFLTAFEVVGASGAVRPANPYKPGLESQVEVTDADGDRRVITTGGEELYSGEIEDLARAVLDGATPRMTLEDSRGNAAALVALYESARTGRPVTVGRA